MYNAQTSDETESNGRFISCDELNARDENAGLSSGEKRRACKTKPGKWFLMCPRCWALLLGLLLPMWLLIAVSFAFGYGLAVFEAVPELDRNDDIMFHQELSIFQTESAANITQRLPILCLEAYASNRTVSDVANDITVDLLPDAPRHRQELTASSPPMITHDKVLIKYIQNNPNSTLDLAQLLGFLESCSIALESYVRTLVGQVKTTALPVISSSELTFSWNRCPLSSNQTALDQSLLGSLVQRSIVFEGVTSASRQSLQLVRLAVLRHAITVTCLHLIRNLRFIILFSQLRATSLRGTGIGMLLTCISLLLTAPNFRA